MADVRLTQLFTNIANAIRNKKGSDGIIKAADFPAEIESIEVGGGSAPRWTGHADAEGLRAIGWDDDDIAYYQQYGVNWDEDEDEYHKVSDDNKALFGIINANNIQTYRDRIIYLPKIDTSAITNANGMFNRCVNMVALPMIDLSKCQIFQELFNRCYALTCVPPLDFSKATNATDMFYICAALQYIHELNFLNLPNCNKMFQDCNSLVEIRGEFVLSNVAGMLSGTTSLKRLIGPVDFANAQNVPSMLWNCFNLEKINIKNLKDSINFSSSYNFRKESLLYIIENEAAETSISIKLETSAYTRLSADANIQEALANHPNVSLAK